MRKPKLLSTSRVNANASASVNLATTSMALLARAKCSSAAGMYSEFCRHVVQKDSPGFSTARHHQRSATAPALQSRARQAINSAQLPKTTALAAVAVLTADSRTALAAISANEPRNALCQARAVLTRLERAGSTAEILLTHKIAVAGIPGGCRSAEARSLSSSSRAVIRSRLLAANRNLPIDV